ncbi:MAG: tetratricopeptide repeat protein, partial [Myxococcota bacterium]
LALERAMTETRNARATGDPACYERALEALDEARAREPTRARIALVEAWVRLGRHEFALAESLAAAQLAREPDDPDAWALLGDARLELGRYGEAADAYERAMQLRPGPGSYVRAAHYRQATGDLHGASRFYRAALDGADRRDAEGRAWLLVQLASLEVERNEPVAAEALLDEALRAVPEYHSALAALSDVHLRTGRAATALELADRSLAVAPHAERHLLRADALRALGREAEARAAEEEFERAAAANVTHPDNENNHLVDFYLDRRPDPERALEIARAEAKRRPDAPTLERLARALQRNGFVEEARAVRADSG